MSNEFVHATQGTSLTQAEFEAVGLHVFNSQATGDILYASSATQLSRLAIGANALLGISGGIPAWVTTIPAVTLGGAITATGYGITALSNSTLGSTTGWGCNVDNGYIYYRGSTATAGFGAYLQLTGKSYGNAGRFEVYTPDGAGTADTARLIISGVIATAVATWSNVTHSGLSITDGQDIVVGSTSGSKIATVSTQKLGFFGATPVVQLAKASYNNFAAASDFLEALVDIGLINAT